MGNSLEKPITEKETFVGSNNVLQSAGSKTVASSSSIHRLQYGASSMQGWRCHMEDAHICQPHLLPNLPDHGLFAAFDGHGGSFAAKYASEHFCRIFVETPAFLNYQSRVAPPAVEPTTNPKTTGSPSKKQNRKDKQLLRQQQKKKFETAKVSKGTQKDQVEELTLLLQMALTQAVVALECELFEVTLAPTTQNKPRKGPSADRAKNDESDWEFHDVENDEDTLQIPPISKQDDANTATDAKQPEGNEKQETQSDTSNHSNDRKRSKHESGSTAIISLITPTVIVCANVGDSRMVLAFQTEHDKLNDNPKQAMESVAKPLSMDHKPELEGEQRRIEQAGGRVLFGRVDGELAVSRAIGDFELKKMNHETISLYKQLIQCKQQQQHDSNDQSKSRTHEEDDDLETCYAKAIAAAITQKITPVPEIRIHVRQHQQDQFLVLACDGIWDVLSNEECVELVSTLFVEGETDLGLICEEVMDTCLAKGSRDNMTIILVTFPDGNRFQNASRIGQRQAGGGVMKRRKLRKGKC